MREDFKSRGTTLTSKSQEKSINFQRNSSLGAATSFFIGSQASNTALRTATRDKIRYSDSLSFVSIGAHGSLPVLLTEKSHKPTCINDVIGHFGLFQLLVLIFSGLRDACVGYDALVISTLLQPEASFHCVTSSSPYVSNSSTISNLNQCLTDTGLRCDTWHFPQAGWRPSLLIRWQLVCQRGWLTALLESVYFLGLMSGNLVWGYTADKLGRRQAYLASHSMALIFGLCSIMADNVFLFAACRFLAAFGITGYNIIYSIQVELIGIRYRALSTVLNHLGWGLGVVCIPLGSRLFLDHRPPIAVVPLVTLLMCPWAVWLPESWRWLVLHGRKAEACQLLVRIADMNGRCPKENPMKRKQLEKELNELLIMKSEKDDDKNEGRSTRKPYSLIWGSSKIMRDLVALALISLTGHLFYYLLTISFAYTKNLSLEANFIASGFGEWLSVLLGAILLRFISRKQCMSFSLWMLLLTFLCQALIECDLLPANALLVSLNNAIGTVSALLLIFVALIVNQEVFPTAARQTGSSLVNTVAEAGSTAAPVLLELVQSLGRQFEWQIVAACISGIALIAVQVVSKTDHIELV